MITMIVLFAAPVLFAAKEKPKPKSENVIYITMDGLRWQEVFGGAQRELIDPRSGGVRSVPTLLKKYHRETPAERRGALLPFMTGVVAKRGQVFGDPGVESVARATNPHLFSYPGYSEMLVGFADPRINSNAKKRGAITEALIRNF